MHHDLVRVPRIVGAATRHEDAGVAAPYVAAARVVHGEIDGGVQRALDRPLDARVQLPVPQLLDLSRKDVVRLAHIPQECRVVPDRRRQVCPALQQLPRRQAVRQRQAGPEEDRDRTDHRATMRHLEPGDVDLYSRRHIGSRIRLDRESSPRVLRVRLASASLALSAIILTFRLKSAHWSGISTDKRRVKVTRMRIVFRHGNS